MDKKTEKQIIFSLLIIVIILFGISQILPWAKLNVSYLGGNKDLITFYSMGATEEIFVENPLSFFYPLIFFEINDNISKMHVEDNSELINHMRFFSIGFFVLFGVWLISLCVILFSAFAFYNLHNFWDERMKINTYKASIFSLICLFMFYIAINYLIVGSLNSVLSSTITPYISFIPGSFIDFNLHFSTGFILFLIGTIIITIICIFFASKNFSNRITSQKTIKNTEISFEVGKNE